MAPSESIEEMTSANYMKVAHLYMAIRSRLEIPYFERILQKPGDINYKMPIYSSAADTGTNFSLLNKAYEYFLFDVFELLVDHGADFTAKDNENHTVVHIVIHEHKNQSESLDKFENVYVHAILCAHVRFRNAANPLCKYGITHFHAACMTNHTKAVEFFLQNGVSVDETVSADSPIYPEFTPLQFAIRYLCYETAEILLKYGAKVHLKNVKKLTPMMLIERIITESRLIINQANEEMIKLLLKHIDKNVIGDFGLSSLHVASVLKDTSVAESILKDEILDVNQAISVDWSIYSGYTPLHFAAISNMNTLKLLLQNGADIEAKNANNVTPFDLCLQNRTVEEMHYIISSQTKWKEIRLSDGNTRLVDVVSAMKCNDEFRSLLANIESIADLTIPTDSPLWPGCTILHLAVIFSENDKGKEYYYEEARDTKKVEACLVKGVEITKTDVNNSTALHLAFYSQKLFTVKMLLNYHLTVENPFDNNTLSHFHIACAARNHTAVERFLSGGSIDVNIPVTSTIETRALYSDDVVRQLFLTPGSTALHINVACGNIEITKMLLDYDADIYAIDCNGFTPIHRLFTSNITHFEENIADLLLGLDGLRDCVAECGLSYLHVACRLYKPHAVEKLLDSGANINAIVTYKSNAKIVEEDDYVFDPYGNPSEQSLSFLSRYSGNTPLHISIQRGNTDIQMLLLKKGADITAGSPSDNVSPLDDELVARFVTDNNISISQFQRQFQRPMLHIACYARNLELVNELLSRGEDVNMRYPIQPGNTPLHFAILKSFNAELESTEPIELLLKNGADVSLRNVNGDTPLHLLEKTFNDYLVDCSSAPLLLRSVKDVKAHIVDSQAISFFHFACMIKDVQMVKKFLEQGVDVNRPVSYIDQRYTVCSPLHLVTGYLSLLTDDTASQLQIIDLLLEHGADIHRVDAFGNTPLHKIARSSISSGASRQTVMDALVRHGSDVNTENICGETPLEVLINGGYAKWEEVQCLVKHGSRINSYNPISQEGYIAQAFTNLIMEKNSLDNDFIRKLITSEHITEIDSEGRSFLHNFVSTQSFPIEDYVEVIRQLVKHGCHINHQDNKGRTALHVATWFRNNQGILGLMKNGADINITDKNGKTAFAYGFESSNDRSDENYRDSNHAIHTFAMHVHKMKSCRLYISEANERLQVDALDMYYLKEDILRRFHDNIKEAKGIQIGSTALTLFDFGFKMNAEMVYPNLPYSERLEIDQFFQDIGQHNLDELDYLLKIKFENARKRLRLINSAVAPLSILIKMQLPELCCRYILSFLSGTDLESVIATLDL